ncbi:MAG: MmgE/PrpD family protein [Rhizobiales bacterium]|nr:MmgE/PrpD family protein [Hyphomicrobiales bacterium]
MIEALASFVAQARYGDIPADMVVKAKHHCLDTFGAGLAGATSQVAIRAHAALARAGNAGAAPLWGASGTLAPRDAAFVNGIAAHAFELDDTGGCDHSGAVVLPALVAALGLAEYRVSGRDFLTATVLGYDVGRRVMEGLGGYVPHNASGWHSTGTCGVFAAAAATASLLRLSPEQTAACLGIAASCASGLWAFVHDGAMTKRVHAGRAAEAGLLAALLAREGITGPRRTFDDVWGGFFRTYGQAAATPERLVQGLGHDWLLRHAAIKPYASCRDTHAAVDAIGRVLDREALRPQDIRSVKARLNSFLNGMVGGRDVATLPAAQMSLPYAVAARICLGAAGLDAYANERRNDSELTAMLAKVEIVLDETVTASWKSSLIVEAADDRRIEEPTCIPLGHPENPISLARLRGKFDELAGLVLPASQVDELARTVLVLETLDDVGVLPRLLALA